MADVHEINAKLIDRRGLVKENRALRKRIKISDELEESRLREISLLEHDLNLASEQMWLKDQQLDLKDGEIRRLGKEVKKRTVGGITLVILALLI